MSKLTRFLPGLLRYGVAAPIISLLAIALWWGCAWSLIALIKWLAFSRGWSPLAPTASWQGDLIGFFFAAAGGLLFSVGAFHLIGGEKAAKSFTALIKTVFTPLAMASDRWTGSLRLWTGKAIVSRSIHGQSIGPVVLFLGLPLTIGGLAAGIDILTKRGGGIWAALLFFLIAGFGLYIIFYRNRIIIDSGSQTIGTDSGVPGFRFAVQRRPWKGNARLRLFRIRPYIQTPRGRVPAIFARGRINDGRAFWWYLVEFRDDKEAIRLGQFALDSVAIGFAERAALQLGLRWEDDCAAEPA